MARILKFGGSQKELVFNYRSRAALWDLDGWKGTYRYSVAQPRPEQDGFMILDEW